MASNVAMSASECKAFRRLNWIAFWRGFIGLPLPRQSYAERFWELEKKYRTESESKK